MKLKQRGFTLIELSIVLVIIGLIVGGVLVGQDLIKAAQIRSTISQIESFKTAMYAFKNKYSEYPGDISASKAAAFGFTARSGATGHGDNNKKIEGCSSNATVFGCETALFWRDLSQANLIEASLSSATDALTAIPAGSVDSYLPKSDMPTGAHFVVHYSTGPFGRPAGNRLLLAVVNSSPGTGVYDLGNGITAAHGLNIDTKLDDGWPTSGLIRAENTVNSIVTSTQPALPFREVCSNGLSIPPPYFLTYNDPECYMFFPLF